MHRLFESQRLYLINLRKLKCQIFKNFVVPALREWCPYIDLTPILKRLSKRIFESFYIFISTIS